MEAERYGFTKPAWAEYQRLRGQLADPMRFALSAALDLILDQPATAPEQSERLSGASGQSVWKLDARADEEALTVMWTSLKDEPIIAWIGVWPPE